MSDPILENTKKLMHEALERAKKADRLHKSGMRHLQKYSLFVRVVLARRFKSIKRRIKNQEWERFACTSVALNLSRRIKFYERRKRQLENERKNRDGR